MLKAGMVLLSLVVGLLLFANIVFAACATKAEKADTNQKTVCNCCCCRNCCK